MDEAGLPVDGRNLPPLEWVPLSPSDLPGAGPRPRLFLEEARLGELREAAGGRGEPVLVKLTERLLEQAERIAGWINGGTADRKTLFKDHPPRGWYNVLPYPALAYLVTGEDRFLDVLCKRLEELTTFPVLELEQDLAAAHLQLNFSVVYDWLGHAFEEGLKRRLLGLLSAQADLMWRTFFLQCDYFHDIYLQNHHHVGVMGLAAAGTCLLGEDERAERWLVEAAESFRRISFFHPPDGSSCEGPSYAAFGFEAKVTAAALLERGAGRDFLSSLPGLKGISRYLMAHLVPGFREGRNVFPAADCSGHMDKHGPAHFLWMTARKGPDPLAQGLALECVERGVGKDAPLSWLGPLWYEPVEHVPLEEWPLTIHCPDIDLVSHRSGWGENDAAVFFDCGPFQGHRAAGLVNRDMGGAHVHPDSGCFMLVKGLDHLAGDPAGYTTLKLTSHHNCVTVDGVGQLGEGMTWFNVNECLHYGSTARIVEVGREGRLFYALGEYAKRYHPRLGLSLVVRLLMFHGPDVLVVFDHLRSEQEHEYRWLFHPGEGTVLEERPGGFAVSGKNSFLEAVVVWPEAPDISVGSREVNDKYGNVKGALPEVAVVGKGTSVDFLVVMKIDGSVGGDDCAMGLSNEGWRTFSFASGRKVRVGLDGPTLEVE